MNDTKTDWNSIQAMEDAEPVELYLQSLTYDDRNAVLAALTDAIDRAGGWLLERRTVAAHALELRIEFQLRALVDMYAALVGSGIQLTREAHLLLTQRCLCRQHQCSRDQRATILCLRLEVAFLSDVTIDGNWIERLAQRSASA